MCETRIYCVHCGSTIKGMHFEACGKPFAPDDMLFGADAERRRADQLALNNKWIMGHIDELHRLLCEKERPGTWQDRVGQVTEAVKGLIATPGEKG